MKVNLHTVSAFVDNGKGGNLAGVVLNADNISKTQKQVIAKQAGYSETAFVSMPSTDEKVDYSVSFFTPTEEVDFCGHATLALFHLLFQQKNINLGHYRFISKAGLFSVTVQINGEIIIQQHLPKTLAKFSPQQVAPLLNLNAEALHNNLPIEVLSTGLADLIIPIQLGLLDTIKPNLPLIKAFCLENNIIGLHLFELNDQSNEITANCRNFAPLVGINEESATGSACGALACYLYNHLQINMFLFQQGRSMRCSSLIRASILAKNGEVNVVEVGGFAKLIKTEAIIV